MLKSILVVSTLVLSHFVFASTQYALQIDSQVLGSIRINVAMEAASQNLLSPVESFASITRDNGQILQMQCVTQAVYKDAILIKTILTGVDQKSQVTESALKFSIAKSYEMKTENEICEKLNLLDVPSGQIFGTAQYQNYVFKKGTKTYTLTVALFPLPLSASVSLGGSHTQVYANDISFQESINSFNKAAFHVTESLAPGSVSYLEHGLAHKK